MKTNAQKNRLMKLAAYASLTVAIILIFLKGITFLLTGSVAILSSLFDSAQDFMTSAVNMIAVRQATTPADRKHRFGHGKAQAIGGLAQGTIILIAAFFLLYESVNRLFLPKELTQMGVGIIVTLLAIILTVALILFQAYVIRETGSLSIKADRAHYSGDILMNIGVIVSMLITRYVGWGYADSLFGIGVSFYLFVVVYQIGRESMEMLMDTELPEDFRNKIRETALVFPEVSHIHALKTRRSGSHAFVQFCVHMDDTLTLRQAHNITDMIEDRIKEQYPDTEIIIHPEPDQHRSGL